MRVLLVDDEEKFVSVLAKRLRLRGIEAEFACDGETALERARAEGFDIALLDVKMPGLSGIELRRRLGTVSPDLRFIFVTVTGHGSEADYRTGLAEGARYLAKPIEIEDLVAAIHEVAGEQDGEGAR
jgi:DNA-binding response OmpR family regulator